LADEKIHGSQSPAAGPASLPSDDALDRDFRQSVGDWRTALARTEKGALLPVLDNVVQILRLDYAWRGVIAYDEFAGQQVKLRAPPFAGGGTGEWDDLDDMRLELWLAQVYQLRGFKTSVLFRAVCLAADANRFHPVRDYLGGLKWDRAERLKMLLYGYLGANGGRASDYLQAAAVKWMVAAVARVMRPGVKVDNVLILDGPQGALKSTALKVLFQPWFTDAAFELGSTDGYQIMRGMWCVELAELDGYNRVAASRSKSFFSRSEDKYRSPYGRKPVTIARQGVFAGSVNHAQYLKDDSGNRRYWPVSVGFIDIESLSADRDQLWAEAAHLFAAGTEWWVRASEREMYEQEQDARYVGDAWEIAIIEWLEGRRNGQSGPVLECTTADLLARALGIDAGKWTLAEQQRVGRIMARIAENPKDMDKPLWTRERMSGGSRERYWVRVGAADAAKVGA
jgi:predicted P-loop ATPase